MDSLLIALIVAYSFWKYFLGHQGSHIAYIISHGGGINATVFQFLLWYNRLGAVFGLAFLIYLGYVSRWYIPLVVFALAFIGQGILVAIETKLRLQQHAWAISLTGLPILPIIMGFMVYVAANYSLHS